MSLRHAMPNSKGQEKNYSPIQHLWHPFVSGIFVVKANFLE